MKNNGLKSAKAITLIALVVTIIVILILAGVSIAVLTGENGIINRTTAAKKTNEEAEVMENIRLAYNNAQIGKYARKNESFVGTLKSDLEKVYGTGDNNVKVEDNGNDTYTVTIRGKKYTIDENGNVNKVEGFSITPTTLNLQKRVGVDATGTTITATKDGIDGTVHWSISPATGVATLSSDTEDSIQVTPVASADDSAVITATCGSYTKQCTVNVTLVSRVNITFNFNGGMVNSNSSQTFNEFPGDTITLPVPTNGDKQFKGWYVANEGGNPVIAKTETTLQVPNGGATYYAQWKDPYNEGIGSVNTTYIEHFGKKVSWDNIQESEIDKWRLFYADSDYAYLIRDSIGDKSCTNYNYSWRGESLISELGKNLNPQYTKWNNKTINQYEEHEKSAAVYLDTSKWTEYRDMVPGAKWAIGAPTLELYIASYNATHDNVVYNIKLGCIVESTTDVGYKIGRTVSGGTILEYGRVC